VNSVNVRAFCESFIAVRLIAEKYAMAGISHLKNKTRKHSRESCETLHPPGGATALIAVIGSDEIHSLGYLYVLIPVALGACIMLVIALIINNIPKNRRYPEFWM
jgi:CBS-domain-containing membrane protein